MNWNNRETTDAGLSTGKSEGYVAKKRRNKNVPAYNKRESQGEEKKILVLSWHQEEPEPLYYLW
jgi:hypothetical protein